MTIKQALKKLRRLVFPDTLEEMSDSVDMLARIAFILAVLALIVSCTR